MRPGLQPPPSVQIDGDEDRFEEERPGLDPETDPEDITPPAHHPRPEQTEFEGEHRAGDDTHGELDRHDRRPAPRQQKGCRVLVAQPAVVHDQGDQGEGNAQGDQDDVGRQGEGHELPGRQELVRSGRQQVDRGMHNRLHCFSGPAKGVSRRWRTRGRASFRRRRRELSPRRSP